MKLANISLRPILVSDGVSGTDFQPTPLEPMLSVAKRFGGRLVIDDTQALGVLGRNPDPGTPYGCGGGGSLAWQRIRTPEIVVVASLAKGFSAPIAVLAASRSVVRTFRDRSETRLHTSPPNAAAITAARRALAINLTCGDDLRRRLLRNVLHFRRRVQELGLATDGGLFPVQALRGRIPVSPLVLYQGLASEGIRTVLLKANRKAPPRVTFVLTARHRLADIDQAVSAISHCLSPRRCWRAA